MPEYFPAYRGEDPYIFVSYAHDDQAIAFAEMQRIRDAGFNVWYDEGIRPGASWREEVALALTQSSLFVYLVTPNSSRSENCHQELNFALSRDRKILAIHLEKTNLTVGVELSLSNKQAILKFDLENATYSEKLVAAVKDLMPTIKPISLPGVQLRPTEDTPHDKSIAILAFTNRSSDPENEYLCDGIAEELIAALSQLDNLKVASQLASFALKGQALTVQEIGTKLKVAYVLNGAVQKSGERVRATVTLTEVNSATVTWSERYDGTVHDIFELQEDIAAKVVKALQPQFSSGAETLVDTGTTSREAYDAFLRAQYQHVRATRSGRLQAKELYQTATDADPSFGRAWHRRFVNLWALKTSGDITREEFATTGERILTAMAASDYEPPFPVVWYQDQMSEQPLAAREVLAMATEAVRSGDTSWHGWEFAPISTSLADAGFLNGSLSYLERYIHEHPTKAIDTVSYTAQANLLFRLGRFEKATEACSQIYAMTRDPLSLGTRAMLYSRTGQFQKATRDLAELATYFPRNFAQFYDLYWRREMDAAEAYFEWMESRKNLMPIFKIWGCLLTGRIDNAFDYMEENNFNAWGYRVMMTFPLTPTLINEVERHPRFLEAMERVGIGSEYRTPILKEVNALAEITGIYVYPDEDY